MRIGRRINPLYKKVATVFLILFIWSMVAIALDQHDDKYSQFCPICFAKNLLNGTQNSFVLNVAFNISFVYFIEEHSTSVVPTLLTCQGRAPPIFS